MNACLQKGGKMFNFKFVSLTGTIVLTLTLSCSVNTPSNSSLDGGTSGSQQSSTAPGGIVYKNLFKEIGKTDAQIDAKVYQAVSNFFYGPDDIRCYYPVGSDMAYILDSGNNDVRSEGMSYGMMIAVQMNMKNEFDRLWKWAKTYMQHTNGDRVGYFAWQCSTSGNKMDNNSAPDGEEYFAMALYFAWKRWGNGTGIFNYKAEADKILHHMLHQDQYAGQYSGVTKMINTQSTQIVFVPYGSSYEHTDPSYHLPAFYELWARWANADNSYWAKVAEVSRNFFKKTCHPITGLNPDYANFDGTPKNDGGHGDFRFDAWRTIMNIAVDYYWWRVDSWAVTLANRLQDFFKSEGVSTHGNQYSLSGQKLASDHSAGLVAMNAVAGLIANKQQVWEFIDELWNIQPTRGQWRYYDGCLYLLGLLHCSGRFQIWGRDGSSSSSITSSSISSISSSSIVSSSSVSSISSSSVVSSSSLSSSSSSTSSSTAINPYNQVEAENYSSQSGTTKLSGDGGTVVKFNSTSSWIAFTVNFGSSAPSSVTFRAKDVGYGANIIIKLDSPNGQEIGRVYPSGGGVWNTASNSLYPRPTGIKTIYIMTSSPNLEINWFKFQ